MINMFLGDSKFRLWTLAACVLFTFSGCGDDPVPPTESPPLWNTPAAPEDVIPELARAVMGLDEPRLARLYASPETGLVFLHFPTAGAPWGYAEELRRWHELFGSLQSASVATALDRPFVERTDLGLDPNRWRAWGSSYQTQSVFDLRGPTDYTVDGRSIFIVVEDVSIQQGAEGKFRLYRQEDLGIP
jgi:hypothetical protein